MTEVVNGISFRGDSLCLIFMIGTMLLYLSYRNAPHPIKCICIIIIFILALLSKEMAITVIALLIPVELFLVKRKSPPPWSIYAIILSISLLYLILRFSILQNPNPPKLPFMGKSLWITLLSIPKPELLVIPQGHAWTQMDLSDPRDQCPRFSSHPALDPVLFRSFGPDQG